MKNKKNELKKIYLSYNIRLFLTSLIFLLSLTLFCIFIFKAFSINEENRLNYTDTSNLDYKVYLKENDFYTEEYLEKDMVYIANLIDYVNVDFNYDFKSDINMDLDIKYSIIGKLTIQDSNITKNYYEKKYILLDEKTIVLKNGKNQNISEKVMIDYDYYNSIANSFKINYGVDTVSKLTVYLLINKNSNNKEILLNDSDIMSIEMPLSQRSVNLEMKYKEIDDTSNIISKSNIFVDNIIYLVLAIIFMIILLIEIIKLVKLLGMIRKKNSKYDKYIKRLFREYDRLISETSTQPRTNEMEIIKINKFEDLVDIRDNLRLPIMYYSIVKHQKCWFYITHNDKIYLHVVKAVDLEEKKNGKNL